MRTATSIRSARSWAPPCRGRQGLQARLKAHKQLPLLKDALARHKANAVPSNDTLLLLKPRGPHSLHLSDARFRAFQHQAGHPLLRLRRAEQWRERERERERMQDHHLVIMAGAASTNTWRAQNPGVRINASWQHFDRLDLSGINLSGSILIGTRFSECNLSHASFSDADISKSTFFDCKLCNVEFRNAKLNRASFIQVDLDGAQFGTCPSLSKLSRLSLRALPATDPSYDPNTVRLIDRWAGWDRLRFLAAIRIFVPAYASLTLSVIYINGISWYNTLVARLNALPGADVANHALLAEVTPGWTHLAVIASFAFLAIAATTFLACPATVIEFTRERWVSDLRQPRLLYDHLTWRRPMLRLVCAASLALGGTISAVLLVRAIAEQVTFIVNSVT